jgi:tetratricopeptide (TPR) repeat protein
MSKKKSGGRGRSHTPAIRPAAPLAEVREAERLLQTGQFSEARDLLSVLAQRMPRSIPVWHMLAEACYEMQDIPGYAFACERLLALQPDDAELLLVVASARLLTQHSALAVRALRRFLALYPSHERAGETREMLAKLEPVLLQDLSAIGLTGADGLALAALHEEGLVALERGDYAQARALEERVLQAKPDFVPALNNISQGYALANDMAGAIAAARRVLAIDPQNLHALGNLTRYLLFTGQVAEAQDIAARMQSIAAGKPDDWVKKAEALSYLGDDEGVLAAYQEGKAAGYTKAPFASAMGLHLAAVASWNTGKEVAARRLWRQALTVDPNFDLAQANLNDIQLQKEQRNAPWPFTLRYWIHQQVLTDLLDVTRTPLQRHDDAAIARAFQTFYRRHPQLAAIVPLLLARGDPEGREFALSLAEHVDMPEMYAALREFALSQHGPDEQRMRAAGAATVAGMMPAGLTQMWLKGAWEEMFHFGFEVTDEGVERHTPAVEELMRVAIEAQYAGDAARAEGLIQQALALEPDAPEIQNNLAVAYEMLGRKDEAHALIQQIHAEHPDYLFAALGVARLVLESGDIQGAKDLVQPFLQRRRLHISELRMLCDMQLHIAQAEGTLDKAGAWIDMWEQIEPDHPRVQHWRLLYGLQSIQTRMRKPRARKKT